MEGSVEFPGFDLTPIEPGMEEATSALLAIADAAGLSAVSAEPHALAAALAEVPQLETRGVTLVSALQFALRRSAARDAATRLIMALPAPALAHLLAADTGGIVRRELMHDAVELLPPAALLRLFYVAASGAGRPIIEPTARLLVKLASGRRPAAEAAFRALAATWIELHDGAGPGQVRRSEPAAAAATASHGEADALRIVQLALEADISGPVLTAALGRLTDAGQVRRVIDMVAAAPAGSAVAAVIAGHYGTPAAIVTLLREDPIDYAALDALLAPLGIQAVEPLLDALIASSSRKTRRALLDRLAALGPEIGPAVRLRLADGRWYVVRNMLQLLRNARCSLEHVDLDRFTAGGDARVRREALQILLAEPTQRDRAIAAALRDADPTINRLALDAARAGLPPAAVPLLARKVVAPEFAPELRVRALHILGQSDSVLALEALLHYADGGRSLIGTRRLARKSPELMAALTGLARSWPQERRAAALLQLARRSGDDQLRRLAAGQRVAPAGAVEDSA